MLATACSKEQPAAPSAPLVERAHEEHLPANTETLASELVAAGVSTRYRATFEGRDLTRIVETRGEEAAGEYELRGARLLHYSGAALGSDTTIDLRFDLQGALLSAKSASGGTVGDEEIAAIRARAQLLRSHALAQRATQQHQP